MKKLLLFKAMMMIAGAAIAQFPGKISGWVSDEQGKPFDGAIVSLLRASDSLLVKTAITEPDGRFLFEGLSLGSYLLMAYSMGYEKYFTEPVGVDEKKPYAGDFRIQLSRDQGKALSEVKVTAARPFVERKMDRTVINVDAFISTAGGNALEVLERAPGITVDQNGAIQLKGKSGVTIFIDDKPTYLSGADLESYLKSLPAGTLDQIEIMVNPPARYDAAGNAGIINIKTKKSRIKGFNGNFTTAYSQGRLPKTNHSLNFNFRYNKINIFGTGSYAYSENFNDLDINRSYFNENGSPLSAFYQNSWIIRKNGSLNGKLGMDYYVTEKTTMGMVFTGFERNTNEAIDNRSEFLTNSDQITGLVLADNLTRGKFGNTGANLNFRHQFDKSGRALTVDTDYIVYNSDRNQSFKNFIYNAENQLTDEDELSGTTPGEIRIYALKSDYTMPLKNKARFEAGAKASLTHTDNMADYYITKDNVTLPDYQTSNHFKYEETIAAGYVNFNKEFRRLSFQSGLRLEHTQSDGNQLGNPEKQASQFNRKYTSLFPTVFVSYKLDSADNQLTFSYGKRINRPYYQDLDPFVRPLDKFTFYSGNPFLKPSFSHLFEWVHSYKNIINTTFTYAHHIDNIGETIEIDENRIYFSRPGNIGKGTTFSLSMDASVDFAKWMKSSFYAEYARMNFNSQLYDQQLASTGNFGFLSVNNKFTFSKGWSAELSGFYRTSMVYAQFKLGSYGQLNLGVQKKVLKDKGTVRLTINDLLYTRVNKGVINNLRQTYADYHNMGDSRVVGISFNYGFGKSFKTKARQGGGSASDEQGRVKN